MQGSGPQVNLEPGPEAKKILRHWPKGARREQETGLPCGWQQRRGDREREGEEGMLVVTWGDSTSQGHVGLLHLKNSQLRA